MKKRFLTLLMLVCISIGLFGIIPVSAYTGTKYGDYLYYTVSDGKVTISDCYDYATEVEIPAEIDGKPVTSIGGSVFYNCNSLTSITIPDSVTSIGGYAFYECKNLTSVSLPDGVTSIGGYAFYECKNLTSVSLPDGVTSIGYSAFYGCSKLKSISIPDSVTTIGSDAFYNTGFYNNNSNWDNGVLYIGNHFIRAKTSLSGEYTVKSGTKCIAGSAFSGCDNLTSVSLPDGITSIGDSAFYKCYDLASINIPDGVTYIGNSAFYYCYGLVSINIPDGVTYIGNSAFYYCYGLVSINIPDGVTYIGDSAFYYCYDLASINIPDTVTYIGSSAFYNTGFYNNNSNWDNDVLYIGNHLIKAKNSLSGEYTVKSGTKCIAGGTFSGCDSLTSVSLPESITSIGDRAFGYCQSLTNITIPESVTSIGDSAFSGCDGLTSITIPESVTSIGDSAFSGCDGLTSITIPESVTSIGSSAFYDCTGLTSVNWNAKNIADYSYNGNVFSNAGTNGDGIEVVFGDSVEHIPAYLFDVSNSTYRPNITSVTIGKNVISIGNGAFRYCDGLTSINIPDNVTTIGNYAFCDCTGLTSINWNAKNVADFSYNDNVFCDAGTNGDGIEVVFGDSVEHIPAYLFDVSNSTYRPNITSVTIGKNVISIGNGAFRYCDGLTSINIPDNVTTIGNYAFCDCDNLASVTIGSGVTTIGNRAFYYCDNLTSVNITDVAAWCNIDFGNPDDDDSYYYYPTANPLYYAKKLYLNGSLVTDLVIPDGVAKIKDYAFYNCESLKSVKVGNGVTSIGDKAFYDCDNITKLTLPSSVAYVGKGAFSERNINYLYLSDTDSYLKCEYGDGYVPYEAQYIYLNNKRLVSVVVPDGLEKIPSRAFYNCNSLTNVTIPSDVTELGANAFYNCNSIKNVYITDLGKWCGFKFDYNSLLSNGANLYINGKLAENIVIPDGVTEISAYAFSGYDKLISVKMPESLTKIGRRAFSDCDNLVSVSLPDSVTSIGSEAFERCDGLIYVSLNDGLTEIGDCAFENCRNLKYVVIPQSIAEINSNVFGEYCENISLVFYTGSETEWSEMYIGAGNTTLIDAEKVFNATKKTYKFNTNCDVAVDDITDYAIFTSPKANDGNKTVMCWYDNASLNGSSVKFPYYGSATTLYASWTGRTGSSYDDAFLIKENTEHSTTVVGSDDEQDRYVYYEFVPKFTGEYTLYATGNGVGSYGEVLNSEGRYITSGQSGNDFKTTVDLTAGETYYIAVGYWMRNNNTTGTLTFGIETDCYEGTKTVCVTAASGEKIFISIPSSLPEDAAIILACYKGNKLTDTQYAYNKNETICFVTTADFDSAKVMVWDNFASIKPLCSTEIVK